MAEWYYVTDGRQIGPVTPDELAEMARTGTLRADAYVWTPGMGDWQRAAEQSWFEASAAPAGVTGADATTSPASAHPPRIPDTDGHPLTHPSGLHADVRNWAMFAHLSAFAGALVGVGALAFVGPLLVWLIKREEHPFVAAHAREALNFNLSVLLYGVVTVVLMFALIGFFLLPALVVFWLVVTIIAAVKASGGESYRYPLTIRFVSG